MERVPKAWMFTLGLSVLAVAAAVIASTVGPMERVTATTASDAEAQIESCFRYGRLECCLKPDGG